MKWEPAKAEPFFGRRLREKPALDGRLPVFHRFFRQRRNTRVHPPEVIASKLLRLLALFASASSASKKVALEIASSAPREESLTGIYIESREVVCVSLVG